MKLTARNTSIVAACVLLTLTSACASGSTPTTPAASASSAAADAQSYAQAKMYNLIEDKFFGQTQDWADHLGYEVCTNFALGTGSRSDVMTSWFAVQDGLTSLGFDVATSRKLFADATAGYCPAKSKAEASGLAIVGG